MARHIVLLAAVVVVTESVAACGGTNDARIPSPGVGVDAGNDGASHTGMQPCGSNESAAGPIRLATAKSPSAIAIEGGNVYWIDSALGTVNEVSAWGSVMKMAKSRQ